MCGQPSLYCNKVVDWMRLCLLPRQFKASRKSKQKHHVAAFAFFRLSIISLAFSLNSFSLSISIVCSLSHSSSFSLYFVMSSSSDAGSFSSTSWVVRVNSFLDSTLPREWSLEFSSCHGWHKREIKGKKQLISFTTSTIDWPGLYNQFLWNWNLTFYK